MCGIVGVASTEGMKNRGSRLQFMKMGLDIDSWRGWESTGLALVPEGSKDSPIVYKRAINGRDFIQLNQVEKYLDDIEKYSVALGHNRAATTGRGNIVDHNAHPFQYGRITLVHNGHIRNTQDLKGAQVGAKCQVDSAHVAFSMNENGEKETLESVEGGFVFVWWNSETSLLNIARNTERPMHMAYAAKENTLYWASELTELLHLLKDVDIDEDIGILYPKAWNWYQYDLKNLREPTRVPFVKRQGRHQTTTTNTGHTTSGGAAHVSGGAWTDEELAAAYELQMSPMMTDRTTDSTEGTSEESLSELDEIRQTVSNQRLKDAKMSGLPTSKKRIARAKAELMKQGINYNSMRNCTPISWVKYRNQTNLGSVLARTKKGGFTIEVLQIRHEQYLEYHAAGNLLVDCVNVRNGPNNDFRIIGIVSARMKDYLEKKKAGREPPKDAINSTERTHDGPNGKVTLSRFLELTDHGCANCRCDLDPKLHGTILWAGAGSDPVCSECSSDPGIMELLGIADQHRQRNVH